MSDDFAGKKRRLAAIAHLTIDTINEPRGHFRAASRATLLADKDYEVDFFLIISLFTIFGFS